MSTPQYVYSSDSLEAFLNYHCPWLWLLSSQGMAGLISESHLDTLSCQTEPQIEDSPVVWRTGTLGPDFHFLQLRKITLPLGVFDLLRSNVSLNLIHFHSLQLSFLSIMLSKSTQQILSKCEVGQAVKLHSKDVSNSHGVYMSWNFFLKHTSKCLPLPTPSHLETAGWKGKYPVISHLPNHSEICEHTKQTQGT